MGNSKSQQVYDHELELNSPHMGFEADQVKVRFKALAPGFKDEPVIMYCSDVNRIRLAKPSGKSVATKLAKGCTFTQEKVLQYAINLYTLLFHLNTWYIIHGNITTESVLIDNDRVQLAGLSKKGLVLHSQHRASFPNRHQDTYTGKLHRRYILLRDQDVYDAGVVLCEMLFGRSCDIKQVHKAFETKDAYLPQLRSGLLAVTSAPERRPHTEMALRQFEKDEPVIFKTLDSETEAERDERERFRQLQYAEAMSCDCH